jgi:hypothetical protein
MATQSDREPTTFYGACPTCGAGHWADVSATTMCGPSLIVVCQHHFPVSDVELLNSHMFGHDYRKRWAKWRKEAEASA